MFYERYLNGIKNNLKYYKKLGKEDIELSRFEEFDKMFKTELLEIEGIKSKTSFIKKKIYSIGDIDYRVACFYAKFLSEIIDMSDTYSFARTKFKVYQIARYAYVNGICRYKYSLEFKDSKNVLYVKLVGEEDTISFSIENSDDFVWVMLSLVAELGSGDEKSDVDRKLMYDYLLDVCEDIVDGNIATPYKSKNCEISTENVKTVIKTSVVGSGKVVNFPG